VAEPRWLDPTEMRAWRGLVETCHLLFEQLGRELQTEHQLSHADYEILVRLSESEQRQLRMSELADATLSSRSRLSHQISRLERRGLVCRRECETDRRGQFAVLTDEGFAVLERAAPSHVRGVREHLLDQLSDDQVAALGEIADRINRHLYGVVHR